MDSGKQNNKTRIKTEAKKASMFNHINSSVLYEIHSFYFETQTQRSAF